MYIPLTSRIVPPDYEFALSSEPDAHWVVASVVLDEQLDQPYCADVELWSESDEYVFLLGANSELVLLREDERRHLHGLIAEVELIGEQELGRRIQTVVTPGHDGPEPTLPDLAARERARAQRAS